MTPQLFYTLKVSHLTHLESELRNLKSSINELHVLEKSSSVPDYHDLDTLEGAYLDLFVKVQRLKAEIQPLAVAELRAEAYVDTIIRM